MHNLTFTDAQLVVIDRALSLRPYAEVAPLIAEINRQLQAQQAAAQSEREQTPASS